MAPANLPIQIRSDILTKLILSSFRYAVMRNNGHLTEIGELIISYKNDIESWARAQIIRDLHRIISMNELSSEDELAGTAKIY